jgi:flagellar motor switch protein FliG
VLIGAVDAAKRAMKRAIETPQAIHLVRNIHPNQLVPFIAKEHPQTIAIILSQPNGRQAAGVLNGLPEGFDADVSYRMGTMEPHRRRCFEG